MTKEAIVEKRDEVPDEELEIQEFRREAIDQILNNFKKGKITKEKAIDQLGYKGLSKSAAEARLKKVEAAQKVAEALQVVKRARHQEFLEESKISSFKEFLIHETEILGEDEKKEGKAKVSKTLAQKVYHRDYMKTKNKKYRKDQE